MTAKWNWKNPSTKQVALLAVLATLISAAVAASAALTASVVDGWNAREQSRLSALREYRLSVVSEPLQHAEQQFISLQGLIVQIQQGNYAKAKDALLTFDSKVLPLLTLTRVLSLSPELSAAASEYTDAFVRQIEALRTLVRTIDAGDESEPLGTALNEGFADCVTAYANLRRAAEEYVFAD